MQQPAELKEVDGVPIVEMFGESDLANMAELQACFTQAESANARGVIVSLLHAEYFDSSTIHALVSFGDQLKSAGRRLLVVGPSGDSGRRILSIFGLAGRAPIYDTLTEALERARTLDSYHSGGGCAVATAVFRERVSMAYERDLGKQNPPEGDLLDIDDEDTDTEDEMQEGESGNTGGDE